MNDNNTKIKYLLQCEPELQLLVNKYLQSLKQYQILVKIDRKHYQQLKNDLQPFIEKPVVKELLSTSLVDYKHFQKTPRKPLTTKIQHLATDDLDFLAQVHVDQIMPLPIFPEGTEIINYLHQIRKRTMYIKRGYTILQYVQPVYKALTRLRRGVVKQSGYKAMSNAWQAYLKAFDDLQTYYEQHYLQAGGTPRNYHGHSAHEK
ncbi:hypothetical protein [Bombilactobacillus thymidiniphilus]|uniref:Uncharacterized protein n=1 Tax=Bombilactobacillus thymidiniphilus TaxID=2923363 RepID=A0ABY4PCU4_9LACO|nr:hypothetical protein [Bombilactobacillus thymidiniphilus]UQS83584.1 hypothetical protein MOO47_07410 [Bombilactobacillus thymidiniphilus]